MPDEMTPAGMARQITDLEARLAELRLTETLPEADPRGALSVALAELEQALDSLRTLSKDQQSGGDRAEQDSELRLMRTVFADSPVPMFLLDRDAGVRRANRQAAALLGTSPGYVAGKPFPSLCDLQSRITLRAGLTAVVRTGAGSPVQLNLLGKHGLVTVTMVMDRVWVRGEPDPLVLAAAVPAHGSLPAPLPHQAPPADAEQVGSLTHRMDVLATATELFLDGPSLNEPVAVRRCASLLAAELADWVIIDTEQKGELARQVVFGPDDEDTSAAARTIEDLRPGPLTLGVHTDGQAVLQPHVEDINVLGVTEDGMALCGLMGVDCVLSVPITDGRDRLGVITLAVGGDRGRLDLLDLGLVQRLGHHLALVIKAARDYRRRTEVADALQASLLPQELPTVAGLDLAGRYSGATQDVTVGGDFYDVFRTVTGGWGFVLGDVSGKGEQAAAVTAIARHGVRLLARWKSAPAEILAMVNEALLESDRFVTAVYAAVETDGLTTTATLGSAGHPAAIVIRADGLIRTSAGGGVPLGLFEDFDPAVETFQLDEGDTLLLHSDGVLDACDSMRERFGQERLIEVLSAHRDRPVGEMLLAVERALVAFCDGDLSDDLSMLALRVLPTRLG